MASRDILPYQKYQERFRKGSQKSSLREAVWEAEEDPDLELTSKGKPVLEQLKAAGKKVLCIVIMLCPFQYWLCWFLTV